jgi:flagellar assembly factor FliW
MDTINAGSARKIKTLQFGELDIEQSHIFNFPNGLLGFEDLREFVLISEEETVPFKWLICVEKPEIGFPLLSPWHIDLTYEPGNDFNLQREVILCVITLEDEKGLMTANMKAPVILDVIEQTGKQIILPSDKYIPNYIIQKQNR